jgi:hypothetical protein
VFLVHIAVPVSIIKQFCVFETGMGHDPDSETGVERSLLILSLISSVGAS